jgi:hypothetical protein
LCSEVGGGVGRSLECILEDQARFIISM